MIADINGLELRAARRADLPSLTRLGTARARAASRAHRVVWTEGRSVLDVVGHGGGLAQDSHAARLSFPYQLQRRESMRNRIHSLE